MPVQHDPLTQIVNVHWGVSGLAVEFGDKAENAPPPSNLGNE